MKVVGDTMEEFIKRLERLEYYQSLLVEMVDENKKPFHALVMRTGLSKREVEEFFQLCEGLHEKWAKQKAEEGEFVFYTPLFNEFKKSLHPALDIREVLSCCISQNIFPDLMKQLKKNL